MYNEQRSQEKGHYNNNSCREVGGSLQLPQAEQRREDGGDADGIGSEFSIFERKWKQPGRPSGGKRGHGTVDDLVRPSMTTPLAALIRRTPPRSPDISLLADRRDERKNKQHQQFLARWHVNMEQTV